MRYFGMIPSGNNPDDKIFDTELPSIPDKYRIPRCPDVMNQGQAPICAAISVASIMEWQSEVRGVNNGKGKTYDAYQIYGLREDKHIEGMIPRDAFNKVKTIGVNGDKIEGYAKLGGVLAAKSAILTNGPVMIGTAAYNDDRFWIPNGSLMGGHATILVGWDKDGFVLQNSWGTQYADGGRINFPYEDWKYILEAWTVFL